MPIVRLLLVVAAVVGFAMALFVITRSRENGVAVGRIGEAPDVRAHGRRKGQPRPRMWKRRAAPPAHR